MSIQIIHPHYPFLVIPLYWLTDWLRTGFPYWTTVVIFNNYIGLLYWTIIIPRNHKPTRVLNRMNHGYYGNNSYKSP